MHFPHNIYSWIFVQIENENGKIRKRISVNTKQTTHTIIAVSGSSSGNDGGGGGGGNNDNNSIGITTLLLIASFR